MKSKIVLQLALVFGLFTLNRAEAIIGDGTSVNPYQIQNLVDFQAFCANSSYWGAGKYTKLMADIDLTGITYTQAPIAPDLSTESWFQGTPFAGYFDGNGYVVKNLNVVGDNTTWYMSLFGILSSGGIIENLGVIDCDITGGNRVSGVCGWNEGIVRKCYAKGKASGYTNVAGITGFNSDGGLIEKCFADVDVNASGYNSYSGGAVGISDGTIRNVYSIGSVTGYSSVGGLCGNNRYEIKNCYSTGRVISYATSSSRRGGLCGFGDGTVENSFWDTQTSGYSTSIGGTGKTSAQMKTSSSYTDVGWDFISLWAMSASYGGYSGYPIFAWQEDLIGFEYWASSLPENQRGISDCPAGDSIPNLLKYASGLEANTQYSNNDLFTVSFDDSGYAVIIYHTSKEVQGIEYRLLFKEQLSLNSWQESPITPVWIEDQGTRSLWKIKFPISGSLFMKMQAEQTTD